MSVHNGKGSPLRWLLGAAGAAVAVLIATQVAPTAGGPAEAACEGSFTIDFAGFPAGTIAGEQYADKGVHISAQANEGRPNAIVVFDSNAPATHDPDLEVHLGNILVLADNVTDGNGDGLVDDPDENNFGGVQTFGFDQPVHIGSFKFIDKDHDAPAAATAFDASGNPVGSAPIVNMGDASVQTVTLNADNVSRLEIQYPDSGALTGIEVRCGTGGASTQVSSLGVDPGTQTVTTGATNVTANVAVAVSGPGVAAFQMDVTYDAALLTATSCNAAAGAVCNHTDVAGTVRFEGNAELGMSPIAGSAQLGSITFTAGNTTGTSALTIEVGSMQEPDSDNINVTPTNGQITIVQPGAEGTAATGAGAQTAVAAAVTGPQRQPENLPATGGNPGEAESAMPYAAALLLIAALAAVSATVVPVYLWKRD